MYDTIRLFINSRNINNIKNIRIISEKIDSSSGEIKYEGQLKNFHLKPVGNGIFISGSLPKYYLGNNLQTLNRFIVKDALEMISDDLEIDISNALVTRLDIATNFLMNQPVVNYYRQLDYCGRFEKSIIGNSKTLMFSHGSKSILFYDKLAESKKKKQDIPAFLSAYQGNVLRYELQIKRNVAREFKKEVRASMLYDKDFYLQAVKKWESYYFLIKKQQFEEGLKNTDILNTKLLQRKILKLGVKHITFDYIMDFINSQGHLISYDQKYRLKKWLIDLTHDNNIFGNKVLTKELDNKILHAVYSANNF